MIATIVRQSNVFFTQQIWPLEEAFDRSLLECWNIINSNSVDANPAHSLRRSAHRMPLLDTPLLLLVSEINIANVRLLVSAKTLVYTLIPYLSAVIRRIPYVLALGKLGFNTIHQTIHVAFINCGWICDLLRIEDFIEKGILLGCCGFCLSSRESHTFKQFPAEFAAVNSDDKILK